MSFHGYTEATQNEGKFPSKSAKGGNLPHNSPALILDKKNGVPRDFLDPTERHP